MTRRSRFGNPQAGGLRSLVDFYVTTMRTSIQQGFQYRAAHYMYMLGMVAEPVIYLVVWSTIAEQSGGSVNGLTPGYFAAYYIVWTLVRNMNIVFTPYGWEWRIREGELSGQLLRPLHPIHHDLAWFAGWKVVVIVALAPDRSRPFPALRPDLRRASHRDRRVRDRHLGRLPDPVVQPVRARDDHVLDDERRSDLLSSTSCSSSCSRAGSFRSSSCPTGCRRSRGFSRFGGPSSSRSRHSSVISPIRSCSSGSRCRCSGSRRHRDLLSGLAESDSPVLGGGWMNAVPCRFCISASA